ncbi:serine/threonine-protein kinase TAO1-like isoform X2 [Dendrobium catenatum]|uniref:serine/threonine-protein kinase TAO1-like isoform X2 n=1 Tax=Dendrobium catenatum TaxID=906689 RepID=UPI00109FC019|nr:serine/threonine-protein kinase TAO1-like isoform X2 [Dendrobium catenatum]
MHCWPNAGASKRKIRRITAETPPDRLVRHTIHSALTNSYQSSPSYLPQQSKVPGVLVRALTSPIMSRPHSAPRPYRFLSLRSFICFFSPTFLAKLKGSGKAVEIPRGQEIEAAKEEPQLVETMMKDGSGGSPKKAYSVSPADYRLLDEVGQGASATVYRAMYIPFNEIVAVKCMDLDRCNSNLDDVRREAQTMSLMDHPNVVKGYCSFVVEHTLWVVMPFMAEGSCLHLMKVAYPNGFEEHVIGSILKETLKALEYLHKHGSIHRDVKAGNILLDSSGVVKLSDFGVTAGMFDKGDRQRSRNTFVGTPCWMAPEVMQPGGGYDFKADIWSFGITALELAHGHAPFSKYPPMKVLLMTLQNAPPGLDYDRDRKFSKSFREMASMCLVKDQTKRPTAEKLLKHPFFKNAKPPELSVKSLLTDLPPLWDRVKALELKDAEQLALKKMASSEQEALSMIEYQKAVSAWNFDLEDLKIQASLIVDDENIADAKEDDKGLMNFINNEVLLPFLSIPYILNDSYMAPSNVGSTSEKLFAADKNSDIKNLGDIEGPDGSGLIKKNEFLETDVLEVINQDRIYRYDNKKLNNDSDPSTSTHDAELRQENEVVKEPQMCSIPLRPSSVQNNSAKRGRNLERAESESQLRAERSRCNAWKDANLSGPLMLPNRASANSLSAPTLSSIRCGDSMEDKFNLNAVQIKGRFSVTSENVDAVKGLRMIRSASVGDCLFNPTQVPSNELPKENINISLLPSILMTHLQNLARQTSSQQVLLTDLLTSMQQNDILSSFKTEIPSQTSKLEIDVLVKAEITERERLLLVKFSELQARMINLTDELTAARSKNVQLQQQINAAYSKRNEKEAA